MLSKRLKSQYIVTIFTFVALEIAVVFLYVYALINLTFSVWIILAYIFSLIGFMLIFIFRLVKLQKYYFAKKVKVKYLKRPLDLPKIEPMSMMFRVNTRMVPYFLYKQDQQGHIIYHDILESLDQYQTFEIVNYNMTYALIKDAMGSYYITYLDDLEVVDV